MPIGTKYMCKARKRGKYTDDKLYTGESVKVTTSLSVLG